MRGWTAVFACAVCVSIVGNSTEQEVLRRVGKTPMAFGIFAAPGDTATQDSLTLYVTATERDSHGRFAMVHVVIPDGLTLVGTYTSFTTAVTGGLPPHHFTIRALSGQPGTYEIHGSMEVDITRGERLL